MEEQTIPQKEVKKRKSRKANIIKANIIKGNMTGNLPDDHPYKNYEFEDKVAVKGIIKNEVRLSPDIPISDWYHLYLVPEQGNRKVDSPRKGWRTTKSPIAYKKFIGEGTKGISLTYAYDEVTILHDPTKK